MKIDVGALTPAEFYRYTGMEPNEPLIGLIGRCGARTVAIGGVLPDLDGSLWGFIDCKPCVPGRDVAKWALRFMGVVAECGADSISVWRDHSKPTSAALLTRLGFTPTGETSAGMEVWTWHR